jgi:small-conductance mechanosensitive channel
LSNYNRMSDQLKSVLIALAAIAATLVLAKLLDLWLAHRKLPPEAATRWATLRRVLLATVVTIGVLAALLTIPEIRAFSAALLASGAVLGIIVGMAAQPTLGNAISGLLIAFAQPLRLHDHVEFAGVEGVVEEIGLTYTFIRAADGARIVVPNQKLASDTIINSTIRGSEGTVVEVTMQLPLGEDVERAIGILREEVAGLPGAGVYLTRLAAVATVAIRVRTADQAHADELQHDLRLRAHSRLRAAGIFE